MFDYKVVNSALDNLLVIGSEIFIDFSIKRGIRKLAQSLFLVEVGPPNDQSAAFHPYIILHKLRSKYMRKHKVEFNAEGWCQ